MLHADDMQEAELRVSPQWVAGFLDGEGSVHASGSGRSFSVCVKLTQKDPKILFLICRKIDNVGCFQLHKGCSGTTSASMSWTGRSALPILSYIKDFVIVKRREVEVAIEICKLINNRKSARHTTENHRKRAELVGKLFALNSVNKQTFKERDGEVFRASNIA